MSQDSREQFERSYCEDNGGTLNGAADPAALAALVELRMGDSYKVPAIARAWYWWKRARAGVVVVLPMAWDSDRGWMIDKAETVEAIEAAGVKVAT